jgi:hypothetical protein
MAGNPAGIPAIRHERDDREGRYKWNRCPKGAGRSAPPSRNLA